MIVSDYTQQFHTIILTLYLVDYLDIIAYCNYIVLAIWT